MFKKKEGDQSWGKRGKDERGEGTRTRESRWFPDPAKPRKDLGFYSKYNRVTVELKEGRALIWLKRHTHHSAVA